MHHILSIHTNTSGASKCIEREREALLAIKTDLVDYYNRLSSWSSGGDCCKWDGVYCDNHTGHLLQLDLANQWIPGDDVSDYQPLQGTLNPKLIELRNLTYLDLRNNFIQGGEDTTSAIGSLTNLRYLDLSKNQFCGGQIIYKLGNLTHLEYLNLAMSCNGDYDADAVQNLDSLPHSLRYLDLSYHTLSRVSDWLEIVNKLPNLRNLTLNTCNLPPPNLSYTNTSNSLASVNLVFNPAISSSIFKWLFNYNTTLVCLDLSFNLLTLVPDAAFRYMTALAYLDLSYNQLSGPIPADVFKNMASLAYLDVSYNELSGPIPADVLKNATSLAYLGLSNNQFSGSIPDAFGHMSLLLHLDLSDNLFDGVIPQSIGQISSPHALERLDLSYNSLVGPMPDVTNLSTLKQLNLHGNRLSGPLPQSIGQHLSSLERLDLSGNQLLSGRIPESFGNLSSLEYIDLSDNRLSGRVPESIGNLSSLEYIDLSDNRLSGRIPESIGNLSSLGFLHLSDNRLNGRIPESLGQIDRLVDLDLSNNNLSGEIPTGTRLQTFLPYVFAGNHLCGIPLPNMCASEKTSQDGRQNVAGDEDGTDKLVTMGFWITLALGFIVGFWGVCGSLIFKRKWRYAYCRFLDTLNDWVYVRVTLIKRQFKDRYA